MAGEQQAYGKPPRSIVGTLFWLVMATTMVVLATYGNWIGFATLVFAVLDIYASVFLMMELGKKNAFFTIVEEGQAKGVTIFGRAHKCLLAYTSHRFEGELNPKEHLHSDSFWNIKKLERDQRRPEEKSWWHNFMRRILFLDLGGLKWVGVWPFYKIYNYTFRWTSLRGQLPTGFSGETKYEETREVNIDYILVRQETYLLDLGGIEDKDLISVDIKLVWTNHVVNPFKALFRVRNWLETSADRLLTYIRMGFAASTWKEFQTGGNLMQTFQTILSELEEKYGVATDGLEIIDLKPPAEFQQAAEKVRMAQAEADASVHQAEAITRLAQAEQRRIEMVMGTAKGLGDEGVAMKIAEDLAKGGKAVVVIGTAKELVKDLVGRRE